MVKVEVILVTGATGYIGGHLSKRLVKEGYSVRGLVRDPGRCEELLNHGVEPFLGDLRDPASLERALEGVKTVYQVAGIFRRENVSRQEFWDTHVQGVENLLDASVRAGVERYVHCSTVGVHGDVKNPPASEETPYDPGDNYQRTKKEGERVVLEYMHRGRLPIVVFRPTGVYGPGDTRFLKLVKTINKKIVVKLGSGELLFHAIYIDDLVDGILRCGTKEKAIGNVYILAGEHPITLNNLFGTIAEELNVHPIHIRFPFAPVYAAGYLCELTFKPLGINPPLYRRRVKFFKNTRWFDISKAKRELEFVPEVDMKTGIRLTVDWYRKAGWL